MGRERSRNGVRLTDIPETDKENERRKENGEREKEKVCNMGDKGTLLSFWSEKDQGTA